MKHTYLEVTFRKGKVLAAYYYLPRDSKDRSARTEAVGSGLLVDYSEHGRPIGIEITSPGTLELAELNRVLQELGQSPLAPEKIAPLSAA